MNLRRFAYALTLVAGISTLALAEDPNRQYEGAKVGQWTLHKAKLNFPGATETNKLTYIWVSAVDGKKVTTIKQSGEEEKHDGKPTGRIDWSKPEKPYTFDPDSSRKDTPPEKAKESDEDLEYKPGKKLKCHKSELSMNQPPMGKITVTRWSSADVPIERLVKLVMKDKDGKDMNVTTLEDYGNEGGKEKK
ncbi:hypothetical protein HY251_02055 [bacterium]|nr:hypothetical protein [bacterium]